VERACRLEASLVGTQVGPRLVLLVCLSPRAPVSAMILHFFAVGGKVKKRTFIPKLYYLSTTTLRRMGGGLKSSPFSTLSLDIAI
jgi:hypothetical protein